MKIYPKWWVVEGSGKPSRQRLILYFGSGSHVKSFQISCHQIDLGLKIFI